MRSSMIGIACLAMAWHGSALAQGQVDGVAPGDVVPEPATMTALAVRWPVVGDRNLNATIAVAYRKSGASAWQDAYPLFRTFNDRVSRDNAVPDGHLFAGSIVDLEPETAYDVRLSLADPDGGSVVRTLAMRTAAVPTMPTDLVRRHVVPLAPGAASGGSGTASDPFRGLRAALAQAKPGDLMALAPGVYEDGPYVPPSGSERRPLVIQGRDDGEAVLDGGGGEHVVDASRRDHVWLDRLVLRNASMLVRADRANHLVATRNRFQLTRYGLRAADATYRESVGFRILDNVFTGSTTWPPRPGIADINGVTVTGSGHVIAWNAFRNVGDGVHNGDEGRLSASDIHNNDFDVCTDDAIETDYSDTNVRVFRNRITNARAGISMQPVHGGPVYVFRNFMQNLQATPFKLHNDMAGALIFHNTSVKSGSAFAIANAGETVRDVVTRNNLFVGTGRPALVSNARASRTDLDNDGYEWPRGTFAEWNGRSYPSATAALKSGELYSVHGAVPMGPFLTFEGRFGAPPGSVAELPREQNQPKLAPSSRALDRGVRLPNFNDRFNGTAPDLGCCELGEPLPEVGPRGDGSPR